MTIYGGNIRYAQFGAICENAAILKILLKTAIYVEKCEICGLS